MPTSNLQSIVWPPTEGIGVCMQTGPYGVELMTSVTLNLVPAGGMEVLVVELTWTS